MNENDVKVELQCPDCGNLLTKTETKDYYCNECDRSLDENEIRERCGL
ncbi:MAG: hypothetical protein ACFFDC_11960 [Promethearchaeota archaeon]